MCTHPQKVYKTWQTTLTNGTQTGLCLGGGGGLGIHPRGVLAAASLAIIYVHTILIFFFLCCIRLLFILFSMTKMCYFVYAAAL